MLSKWLASIEIEGSYLYLTDQVIFLRSARKVHEPVMCFQSSLEGSSLTVAKPRNISYINWFKHVI